MRANRRDATESEIVDALLAIGASVDRVERKGYDLLVGFRGRTYMLEVKSAKGRLRPSQEAMRVQWRGHWAVVRTAQEAINELTGVNAEESRFTRSAAAAPRVTYRPNY